MSAIYVRFYNTKFDKMLVSAVFVNGNEKQVCQFYEDLGHYRGAMGKVLSKLPKIARKFPIITDSKVVHHELMINRISIALSQGVKFNEMVNSYISQSTSRETFVLMADDFVEFERVYTEGIMNKVLDRDFEEYKHQLEVI